jgi:hypothetical protein
MKRYLFLLCISCYGITISAKSFLFPDVKYSYAKVYYFNVLDSEKSRLPSYIYTQSEGYAEGSVLSDLLLSKESISEISKVLSKGVDGLLIGLSGCFIPRHGIVYFDEKDIPVASISICFECGGVRLWSNKSGIVRTKVTKLNEKAVEQQMIDLKKILLDAKVDVFDDVKEYSMKFNKVEKQTSSMNISDTKYLADIVGNATIDVFKSWILDKSKMEVDTVKKFTAGGDKYEFKRLRIASNTFLFEGIDSNAALADATIKSREVRLPNGIQIGSSLEVVMGTFVVYDGLSNPQSISVIGDKYEIVYTFENDLLKMIVIRYK